jgi:uncharacterized protein YkwD
MSNGREIANQCSASVCRNRLNKMASTIVVNADKPIGPNGLKGNISTDKNVSGVRGAENLAVELLQLINSARVKNGAPLLNRCTPLDEAANEHAFDMNFQQYFDHYNIENKSPLYRAVDKGYMLKATPIYVAEVIAWDRNSPQIAFDSWMASPDNKAVLMEPEYKDVGIACYQGASLAYLRQGLQNWNQVWFWCVVLGTGGLCDGNSLYSSTSAQSLSSGSQTCFTDSDGFKACFGPI